MPFGVVGLFVFGRMEAVVGETVKKTPFSGRPGEGTGQGPDLPKGRDTAQTRGGRGQPGFSGGTTRRKRYQ